ncbi:MAG: hypothetical protein [Caudoviricetes sp.]|nr:MAG: hypothetical protein [Caudoviricetes sp.]
MGAEVVRMRVPKRIIQDEQIQARIAVMYGQSPRQAWLSAMVNLKRRYHAAHRQGIEYGFIKT